MNFTKALAISVLSFIFLNGFAQDDEIVLWPDKSAEYPGGFEQLYRYIQENLVYPSKARLDGKEGAVYVSFVVDNRGKIPSSSITIVKGIIPELDSATIQVIKDNQEKWQPATKNNKPVGQRFTIPIQFKLSDLSISKSESIDDYFAQGKPVIVTVLRTGNWYLFEDLEQKKEIGRLFPNDTLEAIGWAPWMLVVKKKDLIGYVTYAAFNDTPELEKIIAAIEDESQKMEKSNKSKQEQLYNLWQPIVKLQKRLNPNLNKGIQRKDSLDLIGKGNLFLRMSATKSEVFEGECVIVKLEFYINQRNRLRLRFHNLGEEMNNIFKDLQNKNCWNSSTVISNVEAKEKVIGKNTYSIYKISEFRYCPVDLTSIYFKPITIKFDKMKAVGDSVEQVVSFSSNELTIKVKPIPSSDNPSKLIFYKPTGTYLAQETTKASIEKLEKSIYQLKVYSAGFTFPLEPPSWSHPDVSIRLKEETDEDTVINNQYYSLKIWEYIISSSKPGTYDFSKVILNYFNPYSQKKESLTAGPKFTVESKENSTISSEVADAFKQEVVIAFDISKSMLIEDYSPNRLGVIKTDLTNFLTNRKVCNVGLVAFAGQAKQLRPYTEDLCYNKSSLDYIQPEMLKKGTAIGEAIWLSLKSYSHSTKQRILVLIGDGDNTAGHLPPEFAIRIAKKSNLKIYTIGVGHTGLVSFGHDYFGKPLMVDNTFSDSELKKISISTGGKYYWAEKSGDIKKFLKEIFVENGL